MCILMCGRDTRTADKNKKHLQYHPEPDPNPKLVAQNRVDSRISLRLFMCPLYILYINCIETLPER